VRSGWARFEKPDIFKGTDDRIRFPLTDELHALFFEPGPNYTRKPDQIPEEPGIFKAGISGVSVPICLYCPPAEGQVTSIYVMKAAPFGLTTEAIEAAKHWRFERGKKDGKPVSVRVETESTFHFY
jgi:Gram-negative bacterial TonB protein C-terminal